MSQAEELLNSLDASNASEESNIVIGKDRFITVPESLKRLAVQYDHDIETVTFDCPRYWDEHDMSTMAIYINYICADNEPGCYQVKNVTVDSTDSTIMHFDWTISKNVTMAAGQIAFLVCIKKTDAEGVEKNHWNSEICKDCYVSPGMEYGDGDINEIYPDILAQWRQEVLAITDDIVAARENGEFQGEPGVSPTIQVSDIEGGHRVTITDVNGTKSFDVKDTIVDGTEAVNALLNQFVYKDKVFNATSSDGVTYTITDDDFTESYGTNYMVSFNRTSTTPNPYLCVNNSIHTNVKKMIIVKSNKNTSLFPYSELNSDWLRSGVPVRITFKGQYWVADFTVVSASNLIDTLPIAHGGTGATNIEQAAKNLKFNSLAYATDFSAIDNINAEIPIGKYYISANTYQGSGEFPFLNYWNYCILTVEDSYGQGGKASTEAGNSGNDSYYFQTIVSDQGEKFSREIVFNGGAYAAGSNWIQCHVSASPIRLNVDSYGEAFPTIPTGNAAAMHNGQIFFKKNDGVYIYLYTIGWVKYF